MAQQLSSGFEFGLAPAFLRRDAQKLRICSKWSPWTAGCGSCGAKWCFVRCLQFGQNLEELAHGVRPGHADILVLEYEEIAIPPPDFLPNFMALLPTFNLKVGRKLLKCGQRNCNLA